MAHSQNIVHADIKPENVLIMKNGEIKVADLGISEVIGEGNEIEVSGKTLRYASPEVLETNKAGYESDIFSLGCTMYELFTHKCAFTPEKILSEWPEVPEGLDNNMKYLIGTMLLKDKHLRPSAEKLCSMELLKEACLETKNSSEIILTEDTRIDPTKTYNVTMTTKKADHKDTE